MPKRIATRPKDSRGFPIPWFVEFIDGEPDFRIADRVKLAIALRRDLCWICGEPMGRYLTFPIGPMCTVNRISAEPPSHFECAEYAARVCPFLTQPRMKRNEKELPDNESPAGLMIKRNPGVVALWTTKSYKLLRVENGVLLQLGEPQLVLWYCQGRTATRKEVEESINSGLPALETIARAEGEDSLHELWQQTEEARKHLPPAA